MNGFHVVHIEYDAPRLGSRNLEYKIKYIIPFSTRPEQGSLKNAGRLE